MILIVLPFHTFNDLTEHQFDVTLNVLRCYDMNVAYEKADAEAVISAIAQIAEHHFLFVVRIGASDASFALHALPFVLLDDFSHGDRHFPTPRMSAFLADGASDQLLHSGDLLRMSLALRQRTES